MLIYLVCSVGLHGTRASFSGDSRVVSIKKRLLVSLLSCLGGAILSCTFCLIGCRIEVIT